MAEQKIKIKSIAFSKATIASTSTRMDNEDYYALDTTNNVVYIIHPIKNTDTNYSAANNLVLYSSANVEQNRTAEIFETIQFAVGDTLSIADLSEDEDYANIVGLYAVKKTVTTATAPSTASYHWALESAE